jgi:hypothetical protein
MVLCAGMLTLYSKFQPQAAQVQGDADHLSAFAEDASDHQLQPQIRSQPGTCGSSYQQQPRRDDEYEYEYGSAGGGVDV